jgi:hypothetical protein
MKKIAAMLEVKRQHGLLVLNAIGRTPKGKKFIKGQETLDAQRMSSKKFKGELAVALKKLYGSDE